MSNPPPSTPSDARVRVLVVDDNSTMLAVIGEVLSAECEIVGTCSDGSAALAALSTLSVDVIVLDISMSGMSGLDVAVEARQRGCHTPIVFISASEDAEIIAAAQAAGGLGYVVKLRLISDLLHAVREARNGRAFVSRGQ